MGFDNICKNWIFLLIFFGTLLVQIFIVQFLNMAISPVFTEQYNTVFTTQSLGAGQWLINIAFGIGGLIYGIIIRAVVTPNICKKCEKNYTDEEEIFEKQQEMQEQVSILNSKLGRSKLSSMGVSKVKVETNETTENPMNSQHTDEFM